MGCTGFRSYFPETQKKRRAGEGSSHSQPKRYVRLLLPLHTVRIGGRIQTQIYSMLDPHAERCVRGPEGAVATQKAPKLTSARKTNDAESGRPPTCSLIPSQSWIQAFFSLQTKPGSGDIHAFAARKHRPLYSSVAPPPTSEQSTKQREICSAGKSEDFWAATARAWLNWVPEWNQRLRARCRVQKGEEDDAADLKVGRLENRIKCRGARVHDAIRSFVAGDLLPAPPVFGGGAKCIEEALLWDDRNDDARRPCLLGRVLFAVAGNWLVTDDIRQIRAPLPCANRRCIYAGPR